MWMKSKVAKGLAILACCLVGMSAQTSFGTGGCVYTCEMRRVPTTILACPDGTPPGVTEGCVELPWWDYELHCEFDCPGPDYTFGP